MTIKAKLLEAAKTIDGTVALDSIFESVDLSADVKAQIQTVFESAVKVRAVTLAETHIADIASRSEEMVESRVQEEISELTETLNTYLDHVANKWLEENAIAVENRNKAEMFESLMVGMKEMFVEHNIVLPEEGVDVVAEMEQEVSEAREELNKALTENASLQAKLDNVARDRIVESKVATLSESQKEKVMTLVEGIEFGDTFETKLSAIVDMVAAKAVTEATVETKAEDDKAQALVEADEANANFEDPNKQIDESTQVDPRMAAYLAAL